MARRRWSGEVRAGGGWPHVGMAAGKMKLSFGQAPGDSGVRRDLRRPGQFLAPSVSIAGPSRRIGQPLSARANSSYRAAVGLDPRSPPYAARKTPLSGRAYRRLLEVHGSGER